MKFTSLMLLLCAPVVVAQTPAPEAPDAQPESTFSVRSSLVLVPAMVKTKGGAVVYTLTADDFVVTDDGINQKLRLEEGTDSQPLALVVLVETGASGVRHLDDYRGLGAILDAVVGAVPHRVAIVAFDSAPALVQRFTTNVDAVAKTLGNLDQGDERAAILDGIGFSVDLLRKQPSTYRRAILLISETIDHGSHLKLEDALRAISDTNTAIYSIGFSSTKSDLGGEAGKLSSDDPGPDKGCFSRDPNDPNVDLTKSRGTQTFDCLAMLAPPLRLAKMAEILARNGLKKNIPETVARLTGGEYFGFKDPKTLDRDLLTISNHIPNRYVLSFQPLSTHPGLHAIQLTLKDRPNLVVEARNAYWVDDDAAAKP
jgi:VWFA-related protein